MNMPASILLRSVLIPLMFFLSLPTAAQQSPDGSDNSQEAVAKLLYGYLLNQHGQPIQAARFIGDVGVEWQDTDALESAVRLSIRGRDLALAHKYAAAWVKFGGGSKAKQVQAELYLLSGQAEAAQQVFAELMQSGEQTSADLLRQLNILPDAQQAVALGQALFPSDADGLYHLALLAFGKQQLPAAQEAVEKARQQDKKRLDILFLNSRLLQLANENTAALALLEKYAADDCSGTLQHCTLDALLWAYGDYLRNGETGEWRTRLQEPPANPEEWAISAGHWYEQWEMLAAARDAYQRGGKAFMAQLGLARLAEDSGDWEHALSILQKVDVENSSEFVSRETRIAHLLGEHGKIDAALARIEQARQTVPKNFTLLYHHSLLLEKDGAVQAAIELLRRLTEIFPDNPDSWNALGYVMADHDIDLQDAKKYIERALSARPDDPNIIDSLGWVYYRLGDLENARTRLQQAIEISDSVEILTHYGEVLWELGDIQSAKKIWQQAKQAAPDNDILNETLGRYQPF